MKNGYIVEGNTVKILLNRKDGEPIIAIIDREDLEKVKSISGTWIYSKAGNSEYVYTWKTIEGKNTKLYLHRLLMEPKAGKYIDHINGNGLDNRRNNLRIVTHAENLQNTGNRSDNTSGFKGVYFDTTFNKFKAQIQINGRNTHLGRYSDLEEAGHVSKGAKAIHHPYSPERRDFEEAVNNCQDKGTDAIIDLIDLLRFLNVDEYAKEKLNISE